MFQRWLSVVFMVFSMGFLAAGAQAQTPAKSSPFNEGFAYNRLAVPQPVSPSDKIVVYEFFWYDCPHCADFDPLLEAWQKKLPAGVVLERVPVAFSPQFVPQQHLYYALKALGKLDDAMQAKIFNAIHKQHIPLGTADQMANWLAQQGIPKKAFLDAYNSFGVNAQVRQATQMVTDYQISGVPTMAVQGTYTTSAALPEANNNKKVLEVVDYLIKKVQAEKK
ncbi:MAG: thiol:disulfide interchange protein DsbA/DsbL [Thiomonas sp.]|uniref:Thiol:disulfide interchange protein n=1 Tax=Thiomonas arsenitoxydans (strain DSM 22701 / CIP 110005 / 3As) TaxID=426114 RepID=A0A8I1MWW8_THIA3|nr:MULTISPECIES: thiol:disulfide interchange protein DsbA/DsbL [Thiomonas]MBN8744061.1 thiol:disulfide interchange protein DsbA/DsbL [Thiomonas arsenitoxydans]MDE2269522.1 thiol:disulfide interchange protein DsbA/DsbL [Betaproteobacteria bacterium]ODU96041.1 MAG: disulfide bond formation protein DsbA [Thiomonas sp. SCN 64-16]